ncbi:DNA polymerase I [Marinitoga hydrogenitolerans DSM 16785]|uniref:DNA polymerase I n=1 Tax=Marinitoga hydrogenitolerans (strain DSM 16785 / JCM 12826 / AT1271) TaxID=1122195 RepID=A0A1M4YPC3_MARH1|nr:DNA polymerase I [Marinitoga hydrogenitolerans]SHF07362.1 DNA polymerase I [Marinitoga hydrogenitolerans DSM 16785]
MRNLYLIDGSGVAYRAFFALDQNLKTTTGIYTNAIYGVTKMILKILEKYVLKNEDAIIFIMDKKTVTYRHKLLESYKANRPETPKIFIDQIPYILEIVNALGIKTIAEEGYEADDVIATLSLKGQKDFNNIYILSSDKDLMQLVNDKIKMLRIGRGITDIIEYDVNKVQEKYGFGPEKIQDFLALTGDAVDNIPGVKGIGEKTATKLIKEFGSLEEIYKNVRNTTKSIQKKLVEGKEMAFLSKKLVQLVTDVPLDINWNDYIYRGFNDNLEDLLNEFEFKSILRELGLKERKKAIKINDLPEVDDLSSKGSYELLSHNNLKDFLETLKKQDVVSFDLETTSIDPYQADILGIALSFEPKRGYYIDISSETYETKIKILGELWDILKNKNLIGQNLKYDLSIMKNNGFDFKIPYFDTMIAAYLISPDSRRFNMDDLAKKYLNYETIKYNDVVNETLFANTLKDVDINTVAEYSGEDADITLRLFHVLRPKIYEFELEKVMFEIENPLIPVLAQMELNGVYFDIPYLKELEKEYTIISNNILKEIKDMAGYEINPNSPKQIRELLFERLGLSPKKKTKGGKFSTNAQVLEEMKNDHPIIQKILDYRKYQKLLSTYIQAIPKLVNKKTKRVHTSFNQTGAATGRLSSSDPNLQNLPIREVEGEKIRKAVKAEKENYVLLSADYSQIELRVLAHMSKDPVLIESFKKNLDIHTITAAKLFDVPENQVDHHMRQIGKMINFSIIYGVSSYGLSERTGVSVNEAGIFIKKYFELYKNVEKYQQQILSDLAKNGYVETLFGRKRFLNNLRLNKNDLKRMAVNTPIQGTASDIMKLAMIKLNAKLPEYAKMILQVHDEIVIELPEEKKEVVSKIVKETMENVIALDVPLRVDINISERWTK